MHDSEEALRRLTVGEPAYCRAVMSAELDDPSHTLDARSLALLHLGSSITAGSAGAMWQQRIREALNAGLSFDDVVASLLALAPTVGLDRAVSIAPHIAEALGYDIDAALEQLDDPRAGKKRA